MERFIVRVNIDHFRKLLIKEADLGTRATIQRLLGEEEAKLRAWNTSADDAAQRVRGHDGATEGPPRHEEGAPVGVLPLIPAMRPVWSPVLPAC